MAIMRYTWYQKISAFHVHPFVIDYIKLKFNLSNHVQVFWRENTTIVVYKKKEESSMFCLCNINRYFVHLK